MKDLLDLILRGWGWAEIGTPFEVLDVNSFGNVIFRTTAGQYFRIIPEDLNCVRLADNPESYRELISSAEFQTDWKMDKLVVRAEQVLGQLQPDEVYSFVVPRVLGGPYSESNFCRNRLQEIIPLSGDLARQLCDATPGQRVSILISNKAQEPTT